MLVGVHIDSTCSTLLQEATKVNNMGANFIQLFVNTNNNNISHYVLLNNYLKTNNMKCVVHASYTINLSKTWDEYSFHINHFIQEIERADLIGAIGIVVHLGKQLDLDNAEALNNMFSSLLFVHNKTKKYSNIKIFIETSSGQGTEMCFQIQDFAHFFRKFAHHKNQDIKDRFRICLDTCHIFSAGYDLRTTGNINMYLDILEELIGLRYVGLIHLNDSKNELGANIDRHENLGDGFIGKTGLKTFANFFKKLKVPIILETPSNKHMSEVKKYLL
jgi:deoxyribonuclease-4